MEVWQSFPGRGRDVEFVARWSDQSDFLNDRPAMLGTPLYVADAPGIVEAIRAAAHTGHAGDGKIFVGPVTLAQRIRTGEWGEATVRP